ANKNCDDIGCTAVLSSTTNILFTRETGGENADYRVTWEIWEYIGAGGGENEFIVRDTVEVTTTGTTAATQGVSGISNIADCIPFLTGTRSTNTGTQWDAMACIAEIVNTIGDVVRVTRKGSTNTTITGVALVEFTGSNWVVDNNISHTYSAAGANETETTTDVSDWATAFIESGHHMANATYGLDETRSNCWPGASTTTVNFRLRAGSTSPTSVVDMAHVAKNANLGVEHFDSITGGATDLAAGSASPQTINQTITAVSDTAQTALLATADCNGAG
ncbi:unnamed protein product, partial [marine sediment metagenome]